LLVRRLTGLTLDDVIKRKSPAIERSQLARSPDYAQDSPLGSAAEPRMAARAS
jgi:hypothetical protein